MADQWYFVQQGQRRGPTSEDQIKQWLASGQLQPTDLIWKQGMPQWVPASQVFPPPPPDPNAPPPLPAMKTPADPVDFARLLNLENRILLGYRLALVGAAIAAFLPWAQASGSASLMGKVSSGAASISGMNTTWGMIALLVALGGIVFTFVDPAAILKDKVKHGMAGVGGLLVLLAIIAMSTAASHFGKGMNYDDSYGNQISSSAGAGFGVYLTLVCGLASGAFGFINKWER